MPFFLPFLYNLAKEVMGTLYRPCLVANISKILILDFVRFDIYDWVPIFAVLFVTAIVLNTIFPNRFLAKTWLSSHSLVRVTCQ